MANMRGGLRKMIPLGLAILVFGGVIAAFEVPDRYQRAAAAGSLLGLEAKLRRAFRDEGEFQPKKEPEFSDWLTHHPEPGQTFDQYLASRPNVPSASRKTLYILPIGEFEEGVAPDLELLQSYTAAYYHPLPVKMLPVVKDGAVPAKDRMNGGKKQWKSTDILGWLPKRLPADAYAMIAVTMTDLYPDEAWNFVFGQASLKQGVGIFSFARYHPSWNGGEAGDNAEHRVLRRAAKVLTHEMGHMFGIRHCIYYECNMNGANHLEEADATPMHLCPVCLRKLQRAVRFDPVVRYGKLLGFQEQHGFTAEAAWTRKRISAIQAAK